MTLALSALPLALPHWPSILGTYAICACVARLADMMENPDD